MTDTKRAPVPPARNFCRSADRGVAQWRASAARACGRAEVTTLLERRAEEVIDDGRRRLVRHGHLPEREIMTGIGPVAVRRPRERCRPLMSLTSCRRANNRKPSGRCRRSGWPRPRRMHPRPSMPSSRPGVSSTIIDSNASSRIATPCSASTTSQQSTESICAQRTSSKAHSQRSAIAPRAPRRLFNNTAFARDQQTRRGRREKLAAPRRSQSAAESYPWSEVRGRSRDQTATRAGHCSQRYLLK
jgi:hypothetical protein